MHDPDYLVITTYNGNALRRVWYGDSEEPFDLDFPNYWVLERHDGAVRVRRRKLAPSDKERIVPIDQKTLLERGAKFTLPIEEGRSEKIIVRICKLSRSSPFFSTQVSPEHFDLSQDKLELYCVSGAGDLLVHFQPFRGTLRASLFQHKIFVFKRVGLVFEVESKIEKLEITTSKRPGPVILPKGHRIRLDLDDLPSAIFRYGSYWWRVQLLPVPYALRLPVLKDKDFFEKKLLKKAGVITGAVFTLLLIVSSLVPETASKKKRVVSSTEVALKEPKWIEPKPEPKKVEVKRPEPPKPKKEPEPPKPSVPEKKITKPIPKKVEPPKKVQPNPPRPVQLPKQEVLVPSRELERRQEVSQSRSQLENSLKFVSPSKHRAADSTSNQNNSIVMNKKYDQKPSNLKVNDNSEIRSLTNSDVTSSDPISTKGSRTISQEYKVGRSKGAGQVLGRVSMKGLQSGGGSLESSTSSLQISGSGNISQKEIQKALEAHLQRFQYCYEKALLSNSSLGGVVRLEWTISTSGQISGSHVISSQISDKSMQDCLIRELRRVSFPPPKGGPVIIQYPFSFESGSM